MSFHLRRRARKGGERKLATLALGFASDPGSRELARQLILETPELLTS